jgi:hypothetical protein
MCQIIQDVRILSFILVNRNTKCDHKFLSDVTGCWKTRALADCTSSTVYLTGSTKHN